MQGATELSTGVLALIVSRDSRHVRNMVLVIGCALSAVKIERRGAL